MSVGYLVNKGLKLVFDGKVSTIYNKRRGKMIAIGVTTNTSRV